MPLPPDAMLPGPQLQVNNSSNSAFRKQRARQQQVSKPARAAHQQQEAKKMERNSNSATSRRGGMEGRDEGKALLELPCHREESRGPGDSVSASSATTDEAAAKSLEPGRWTGMSPWWCLCGCNWPYWASISPI